LSKSKAFQPIDPASWALIRRLVSEHVRPYLWVIGFSLLCMGVAAAATGAMAMYMEQFFDGMLKERDSDKLYLAAAIVFAIFLAKGASTFGQNVSMNWVGQRVIADVQGRLYRHVINADLAYFHDNPTGELISRFTNDVARLRYAVSDALTGVGLHLVTVVFLIGVMFYQDWILASVTFFVFPVAILPIVRIGRRMRKVSGQTQSRIGRLTTLLDESFQGIRYVKSYAMESYEATRAHGAIDEVFHLNYKAARVRSLLQPIMEVLGGLAIVAVIVYGGQQVIAANKEPGSFFAFITALLLAYEPVKRLAKLNANLQEGLAAAARVFKLLDEEPAIRDRAGARPLMVSGGGIRFDDVRFAYGPGIPALDGVTLEVPAGRTAALVGPSGAGKSTVMNLIPRFYDIDEGSVAIDGQDVRDVTLETLRRQIALVSQEILLFDDTVRANIAYGRPEADDAEIAAAAEAAGAAEFIAALPHGYDTLVGPRGGNISGGQRQRIAIARAMLKNAPILLLDEATSSLDSESERHVQDALGQLVAGRTTLVIAHRLSTVIDAEVIYVMEDGRIVESGRHADLLARGGAYARLYALQFASEEGAAADSGAGLAADSAAEPAQGHVSAAARQRLGS